MAETTTRNPQMTNSEYTPFSNGSEYMAWMNRNCCRCTKYNPDSALPPCEIAEAIDESFATRKVSADIWRRMGGDERGLFADTCTEKVPTDFKDPNQTELIDDQQ